MGMLLITQINDNGTVCLQKGIINDTTNICRIKLFFTETYQHLKNILYYLSRTLIIGASAVYRVALKQPIGSSLVVNNFTAYVRVTSERTVVLVLVPVELSTSISGRHVATYVVNAYVYQISV